MLSKRFIIILILSTSLFIPSLWLSNEVHASLSVDPNIKPRRLKKKHIPQPPNSPLRFRYLNPEAFDEEEEEELSCLSHGPFRCPEKKKEKKNKALIKRLKKDPRFSNKKHPYTKRQKQLKELRKRIRR